MKIPEQILMLEDDESRAVDLLRAWRVRGLALPRLTTAATVNDCCVFLAERSPDLLLLDHDLLIDIDPETGLPNSGLAMAEILATSVGATLPPIVIHSLNETAARQMQALLPGTPWIPWLWTPDGLERLLTHWADRCAACHRDL